MAVVHRQRKRLWLWIFYLDAVLLLVVAYGYLRFMRAGEVLSSTVMKGNATPLDPLLFGLSVAFILGCGLALLRFLPPVVRGLAEVGGRRWPAPLYAALIQVGRAPASGQLVALFLLLAVAFGIFNSQTARTINSSLVDRIAYRVGADIVVEPYFPSAEPVTVVPIDSPPASSIPRIVSRAPLPRL